jgi:hypothetical protein
MPRKHTPSFILELPLRTSPADERSCAIIGNAALGEGLRRLDLMRESKAYQAARTMPRGHRTAQNARPGQPSQPFCLSVVEPWKQTRRIQRAMDRSRRATNPERFNEDGTWKKGARARNRSTRYRYALPSGGTAIGASRLNVGAATANLPTAFSDRAPQLKPRNCPTKRGSGNTPRALRCVALVCLSASCATSRDAN